MEPEDLLEELEEDVGEIEKDFDQIKDDDAPESIREKQRKAEELLGEIHEQLEFLREQVEQNE